MIDHDKLITLEEEFKVHRAGIELPNFIWLMECSINHPEEDKYELLNGLVKLFLDIDINGDKHIEWSEFTQYIIEAVTTQGSAEEDDNMLALEERPDRKYNQVVMNLAFAKAAKNYKIRYEYSEKCSFHFHLTKVLHFPQMQVYVAHEEFSDKICILDRTLTHKTFLELPKVAIKDEKHSALHVNDVALNQKDSVVDLSEPGGLCDERQEDILLVDNRAPQADKAEIDCRDSDEHLVLRRVGHLGDRRREISRDILGPEAADGPRGPDAGELLQGADAPRADHRPGRSSLAVSRRRSSKAWSAAAWTARSRSGTSRTRA